MIFFYKTVKETILRHLDKIGFLGFSFHTWLRLDEGPVEANTRRQLYSLYTNSGSGLEAFFTPDGMNDG